MEVGERRRERKECLNAQAGTWLYLKKQEEPSCKRHLFCALFRAAQPHTAVCRCDEFNRGEGLRFAWDCYTKCRSGHSCMTGVSACLFTMTFFSIPITLESLN